MLRIFTSKSLKINTDMKKIFLAVAAMLGSAAMYAQGNVVTRDVNVGEFSAVDLNGVMNVYLTQGSKAAVRVEADEKVQDKITVETSGNTLYVKTKKGNWSNTKKMNVYITFVSLDEIHNKMVGNLKGENMITQKSLRYKSSAVGNTVLQLDIQNLDIDIAAVGNTELKGKAANCTLDNSSVGSVRAGELLVDNMELKTSAVGNLEYNAKNTVSLKSKGIGKVINKANRETR
jgi:Putative auto-transporter adhesin, head GIN domain